MEVAGARRVSVVGSFNQWNSEATPLRCIGGYKWFIYLPLPVGRYEYRFLVDGQPVEDPKAVAYVPSCHGGRNAVLEVASREPQPKR